MIFRKKLPGKHKLPKQQPSSIILHKLQIIFSFGAQIMFVNYFFSKIKIETGLKRNRQKAWLVGLLNIFFEMKII
ncbi:MAG: hypothetical protein A2068_06130 [Ignavibacteria bacterium GWB2_35_6b]|nr:MAG: hypothetical protein A2068_06130 [Ignavibacteria bacterium GWB2_35_6b]